MCINLPAPIHLCHTRDADILSFTALKHSQSDQLMILTMTPVLHSPRALCIWCSADNLLTGAIRTTLNPRAKRNGATFPRRPLMWLIRTCSGMGQSKLKRQTQVILDVVVVTSP